MKQTYNFQEFSRNSLRTISACSHCRDGDFISKIILLNNPLVVETYKTNIQTAWPTKKSMHLHKHTNCIHCKSICRNYP